MREHLAFDTVPWRTMQEGVRARAIFDGWRRKSCLKAMADWKSFDELYQFSIARDAHGGRGVNMTFEGAVDLARRMFLRAYARSEWGLVRSMSYATLAQWLIARGFPTTASDVKYAATRGKLVENIVPRTDDVLAFFEVVRKEFPAFDAERALISAAP